MPLQGYYTVRSRERIRSWHYLWISPEKMLDELCMPMQMHLVSDYRCISGITNLTFFASLQFCPALPDELGSGCRGSQVLPAAADGLCCMLMSSRAEPKFCSWDVGTQGRLSGGSVLTLPGHFYQSDLKLYLVVHDRRSSSFLKGMLGQEFWSLTGCLIFCKLYFDKH